MIKSQGEMYDDGSFGIGSSPDEYVTSNCTLTEVLSDSPEVVAIFTSAILLFSVIFEISIETIEHKLHQKHFLEMLNKIFKQLMIMGVLSFVIFIMHETDLIHIIAHELHASDTCVTAAEHLFEWVNYEVFSFVILYACACGYIIIAQAIISLHWYKYDELGTEHIFNNSEFVSAKKKELKGWKKICYKKGLFRDSSVHYAILSEHTTRKMKLPAAYPFQKYLKFGMKNTVIKLLNIHFSVYGYLALFLWLNYLRSHYIIVFTTGSFTADIYIVSLGFFLNFLTILMKGIIRTIKDDVVIMVTKETELLLDDNYDTVMGDVAIMKDLYIEKQKVKQYREVKLPKEQEKLFPLGSPDFLIQMLQFLILLTTWYLGYSSFYWISQSAPFYWYAISLSSVLLNIFLFPSMISSLVKAMYTGQMIDKKLILKIWQDQLSHLTETTSHHHRTASFYEYTDFSRQSLRTFVSDE